MVWLAHFAVPAVVSAIRGYWHAKLYCALAIAVDHSDVGCRAGGLLRSYYAKGSGLYGAGDICVDTSCGDHRRVILWWSDRLLAVAIACHIDGGFVVQ